MDENRHRHTVWMDDNVWDQVEAHYQRDNCSTKNEYIEKAVRFYSGYLNTQNAGEYLPRVLADVLEGKLTMTETAIRAGFTDPNYFFGKRMGHLLFKLAVDQCLMGQELAAGLEIDPDQLRKARVQCIKMVKETNGEISFEDAVVRQKGAE